MSPFVLTLPNECSIHILSFLELNDCSRFASTSASAMKETLSTFYKCRMRCRQRFSYCTDSDEPTLKENFPRRRETFGLMKEMQDRYPDREWLTLPTVEEQVAQLARRMPYSHDLNQQVEELRQDLRSDLPSRDLSQENPAFDDLFELLRASTKALRLHAEILHQVSSGVVDGHSASLDRFMGDVLCVTYLIHHYNLGILEGGPTSAAFLKDLGQNVAHPDSCYRAWVFMHSHILCHSDISKADREQLGIPEFHGVPKMMPVECFPAFPFMSSSMRLVSNEFGALGPAFRLRDNVQVQEMTALAFAGFRERLGTAQLDQWNRQILEWLLLLHSEVRKVRPMSVRPPLIRIVWVPV